MSARLNELRRNNTSGVPGLRLNRRRGVLVIDVAWYLADGRRAGTSYPAERSPLAAVARALECRAKATSIQPSITPRAAWSRLKAAGMIS